MMPFEWPIAAPAADQNAPARPAGSDRLSTVRADFFLDPAARLTEQERALMTAMLHCLIGELADEIRAALPRGWAAANDESHVALIDALSAARLLDEPALMALLLRRADEERIATAAKARSGRSDARILQGLVSHENGAVSAAAMALILARGRRRDRFGQCLVGFDDLPFPTAEALVHAIAAYLRTDLAATQGVVEADAKLAAAAGQVLASHNPGRGMNALTADLARLLDEEGRLSDELILAAANEGEVAFVADSIARRSELPAAIAADELLSAHPGRVIALFRMANLRRELVAGLLANIGDLLGLREPSHAMAAFDRMRDADVAAARARLAAAPAYRTALAALGTDHGQRTV